jgi:hypothetical protein
MEKGNVTADAIICDRQCTATDAEIKALAEDIRDHGLKNPVLVGKEAGILIDGLKRMKAYELLGWSVVPALFTNDPSEAADVLEKLRRGKILGYRRAMEIYHDLKVLGMARAVRRRRSPRAGRAAKFPPIEMVRPAAKRATGMTENALNRLTVLMNLAEAGNQEAMNIVSVVFASAAGSRIVGFSRAIALNQPPKPMLEMSVPERTQALSDIVRATEKSLDQMTKVGGLHLLPHEDAETVIARLSDISRTATKIRNEIRRSTK